MEAESCHIHGAGNLPLNIVSDAEAHSDTGTYETIALHRLSKKSHARSGGANGSRSNCGTDSEEVCIGRAR